MTERKEKSSLQAGLETGILLGKNMVLWGFVVPFGVLAGALLVVAAFKAITGTA